MFRVSLFICIMFSFSMSEAYCAGLPHNKQLESETLSLTYLGNVGNKQFFVADDLESWQEATSTCFRSGLRLVQIKSEEEYNFAKEKLIAHGPFWLGARDIARASMFRWSGLNAPIDLEDPDTFIEDYIYYYNYIEQGPLALQMNYAVGGAVFAAHSFGKTAKAFCQCGE
ncbi:hypothetical protein Bhyg_10841 [Pseudolycoriella hygida]|uniref:C-type lectin domain-containing protein n=1 Tax=Pseudolycoriella hygida TaxID=35572 RepID=A0A9Q0MUC5_9DIPT|nr:hypothetical protein Bhyg_10841 [Pseudolycoriella hygida]